MGTENQDTPELRLFTLENENTPDVKPATAKPRSLTHVRDLLDRMLAAGDWPLPELLQQIVNAGDLAVEPLLDLVREKPADLSTNHSRCIAIGLLSVLRRPETIPDLVRVIEENDMESSAAAADALEDFGTPGFDALITLCSKPSIDGYLRANVLNAAANAALDDPARKALVGEIIRPILDQVLANAREELKSNGFLAKIPPDHEFLDDEEDDEEDELDDFDDLDDDAVLKSLASEDGDLAAESLKDLPASGEDFDDEWEDEDEDEDEEFKPYNAEEAAHIIYAAATIADPLARDTIMAAFDEGLVDEFVVTRSVVEETYQRGEEAQEFDPDYNWLSSYREDYVEYVESLEPAAPAATPTAPRPKYRYQDRYDEGEPPSDAEVTEPIRNTGPKLGRNDPCWCGSGKKYKKCHLGKEPAE